MNRFFDETICFYSNEFRVFYRFIIQEKIKVGFIAFIGFIILLGIYISKESYYSSSVTFTYNCLHKKVFGEEIHKLENLCKSKDYENLAKELKISVEIAKSITSIYAVNIGNSPLHEDITNEKLPFYVHYQFSDLKNKDLLMKSIISYLQHLPQGKKRMKEILEMNLQKISFYKRQSLLLDSIKISLGKKRQNSHNDLFGINIKDLFEISERYDQEISRLKTESSEKQTVDVFSIDVVNFYNKDEWLLKNGILYYFLFCIASFLMLFWYKKLYENKRSDLL
ncbi:hypothetical protein [Chryseobacterium sp. EO14]|uniref:hypothetical protein n=1 Tax=Chryseobacterium sp. EO14 TaxID=2950551 RepID=UPI00210CB59C|nr:hypothetical protein [Chryseobacterium sp. EO14]MCQ4142443.1 hypothetical protein [Chryseobacterium sp. EO14]